MPTYAENSKLLLKITDVNHQYSAFTIRTALGLMGISYMGRQVSSKMCACFLCIIRRQFEDLFIFEKGTLNLQNEAVPMCKKTTRKNWHLKSAKKTHAKIGTLNLQNEAAPICKKSTRKNWHVKSAKRGSAYLQKKYAQKLAC